MAWDLRLHCMQSSSTQARSADGRTSGSSPELLLCGARLGLAAATPAGAIAPGRKVDITIQAGCIESISLTQGSRQKTVRAAREIDASDLIVFPGLVNAHVHSNEMLEQGAYDGVPLEEWLALCYPPLASEPANPRLDYLRAMMMAMQSLRSGVAALHDDFVNPGGNPERLDAVLSAYEDIGIRAAVACTFTDRQYLDAMPDGRALCPPALASRLDALPLRSIREQVNFYTAQQKRLGKKNSERVTLTLGPRGPQRCTLALMRKVAELSAAGSVPVHMHVLESRAQLLASERQYGKSFVEVLEDCGLLSERLTMNHAIWLTADDVARMAERGVSVVHNPMSNFKLSSGLSPVKRLLAAGINVALGSDGPATGDRADFMQSVRMAALVHKLDLTKAADAPTAETLLHMASSAGARSMGTPQCRGLAVGSVADLTLMHAGNPAFVPLNHAARQFAYSAGADAVHSVMVAGEPVFSGGAFSRIDASALISEIREAAARYKRDVLDKRGSATAPMRAFIRRVVANARRETAHAATVNRVTLG
jgi:5-methylthioadenosine/S-adenosylhomocysteine deaminase